VVEVVGIPPAELDAIEKGHASSLEIAKVAQDVAQVDVTISRLIRCKPDCFFVERTSLPEPSLTVKHRPKSTSGLEVDWIHEETPSQDGDGGVETGSLNKPAAQFVKHHRAARGIPQPK
jgi:hypothetical protein